jgi:hypothetical protein
VVTPAAEFLMAAADLHVAAMDGPTVTITAAAARGLAALFRVEAKAWELEGPDAALADLPDGSPLLIAREVLAGSLPVLREEDLRIDEYRGAGWAVRITHIPTGFVVTRKGRSGSQAKAEALEELRSKVAAARGGSGGGQEG